MEQFCLPSTALAWLQAISDEVPGKYAAQIKMVLQQAVPLDTVRPIETPTAGARWMGQPGGAPPAEPEKSLSDE